MARQLRIEYPGAVYHVMARGNDRARIFLSVADRQHFLQVLADALARHQVILHAFVLMGNHYHLVVRTPQPNLSRFMHDVNTAYAVRMNRRHRRTGHLLEGRYKAIVIEEDAYLLTVTAYVHLNLVRGKAWRGRSVAERLERAETDPWSTCGDYTRSERGSRRPPVSCDAVWRQFDVRTRRQGQKRYREFLRAWLAEDRPSPLKDVQRGSYLGGTTFGERIERLLGNDEPLSDQVVAYREWRGKPAMPDVLRMVLDVLGTTEEEVRSRRKPNLMRDVVIYLCREAAGRELREIGELLGVKSAAVSLAAQRVRQRLEGDAALRANVDAARDRVIEILKT